MALLLEYSTLTDRYQTTIPASIRKILNLRKGDRIKFAPTEDGRVVIELDRSQTSDEDTALTGFLKLLENDVRDNPEKIAAFNAGRLARIDTLVGDLDVDLDAALDPEDD